MLETDLSPTPTMTRPASTSTPNNGGGGVVSAAGYRSFVLVAGMVAVLGESTV
jgi:hypothetical protein